VNTSFICIAYISKAYEKSTIQKYAAAKKPPTRQSVKKKETNNSSNRKQPRQMLLSRKINNIVGPASTKK
jgi:hypothetical protein